MVWACEEEMYDCTSAEVWEVDYEWYMRGKGMTKKY